jgi:hypothetical protein
LVEFLLQELPTADREIVGHWQWDNLIAHGNWYQEIVMPAFRQFSGKTVPKSPEKEAFNLSALMNRLSRRFLVRTNISRLTE